MIRFLQTSGQTTKIILGGVLVIICVSMVITLIPGGLNSEIFSGGKLRTDVLELLSDPPRSARSLSLIPWLMGLAIGLLLTEIAGRRLSLWQRVSALIPERASASEKLEPARPAATRKWWDLTLRRAGQRPVANRSGRSTSTVRSWPLSERSHRSPPRSRPTPSR